MKVIDVFSSERYAAAAQGTLRELSHVSRLSSQVELLERAGKQIEIAHQLASARALIARAEHGVTNGRPGARGELGQARRAWTRVHKQVMDKSTTYEELGERVLKSWREGPPLLLSAEQKTRLGAANAATARNASATGAIVGWSFHEPFVNRRLHLAAGQVGAHETTQEEIDEITAERR